jgi:hypothetical protein
MLAWVPQGNRLPLFPPLLQLSRLAEPATQRRRQEIAIEDAGIAGVQATPLVHACAAAAGAKALTE